MQILCAAPEVAGCYQGKWLAALGNFGNQEHPVTPPYRKGGLPKDSYNSTIGQGLDQLHKFILLCSQCLLEGDILIINHVYLFFSSFPDGTESSAHQRW